ncbi:transposon ty3-g Gag-Pol polyprotein [Plakobranchus ocellatus]|uniref:Transposon ty3-g Gag-Pol polyprotein n=1 Tax=Plakobranchus ocellatus TaxID=259542 RepID=A0AAV4D790_9GAST|nr:transposon ty3-g Gag-Pol polyprotein [Plakobranchus ocellatus]
MVERFHRTLKAALKARLTGNNWVEELPWVLLGLRTAPRKIWYIRQQSSSTVNLLQFRASSPLLKLRHARHGRPPALPGPPSATETDDTRGQPLAQTHHRQLTSRTGRQVRLPMRFQ